MHFNKITTGFCILSLSLIACFCGCVSDNTEIDNHILKYQQAQAASGTQNRLDTDAAEMQHPLGLS